MHLLRLLWFLICNLRFEQRNDELVLSLRGLRVVLDTRGNAQLEVQNDLRLNARYVLTQCRPEFDPQQYIEAQSAAQPLPGDCRCAEHLQTALGDMAWLEALSQQLVDSRS